MSGTGAVIIAAFVTLGVAVITASVAYQVLSHPQASVPLANTAEQGLVGTVATLYK